MNIAILGSGYVGKALAQLWSSMNYFVTCTTRSPKNIADLRGIAQKVLVLETAEEKDLQVLLENNQVIVVTLAPDTIEDYKNTYLRTAQSIRHLAVQRSSPKTLLYTSSSAVYGDHQGKWVDEESALLADSEQGRILIETEKAYLSLKNLGWKVAVFRLAEIYGPQKDLASQVRFLQKRVLPGKGDHFTNMIHLEDIIGAIHYVFRHEMEGIFNLADDDHPWKKDFYNNICDQLGIPRILWDPQLGRLNRGNKRVSNHKIKAAGYQFIHPHRVLHIQNKS